MLVLKFITVQNKSLRSSLFPPIRKDLLLSQCNSGSERVCVGVGWGVSLWETFVTSVTALLDGWAASIWLQCM